MSNKELRDLFAEYWRIRRAAKAARQLVQDLGSLCSRKTREVCEANAYRWEVKLTFIAALIESYSEGEVIVDGSLPAPDLVPRNVVPFEPVRHERLGDLPCFE